MNTEVNCFEKNTNCTSHNKEVEVCRLCGKQSPNYTSIFQDEDILKKINRCLPINIFPNDKLPSNACGRCLNNLNISYELILTAIEVDEHLRMQLNQRLNDRAVCTDKDTNKIIEDCQNIKREITDEENAENYQNDTQEITNEKNIQNDWKTEREDYIDEFNYKREVVTFTEVNRTPESINLATDIEVHIVEMEYEDLTQASIKQTDDSSDLVTSKTNYIQNNWKIEREDVDEFSCKKEVVAFTEDNRTPESINLATDTEVDIVEVKCEDLVQLASMKQTDNSSDFVASKTTENCQGFSLPKTINQNKPLFYCETCNIYFDEERYFKVHTEIHEERTVICTTCSAICPSTYDLFFHKREKHNLFKRIQLKYACTKCDRFFARSSTWEYHNENKCPRMADKCCKYCNKILTTRSKLTSHLRKHKGEMLTDPTVTVYKCVACSKQFVDKKLYDKHRKMHDPEYMDKHHCVVCNRLFRDKCVLREHQMAVHENVKPHQCNICNRFFSRIWNMKKHRRNHFGHKCGCCNALFKKRLDLEKHAEEIHDISPFNKLETKEKFTCKFCDKEFNTKIPLQNHERLHTGEMPFSCPTCYESFRTSTSKYKHVMREHKNKIFGCVYCGKRFSNTKSLREHVSSHMSEARKYQCDICKKRFRNKSSWTLHKYVHGGERPYKCDVCSASFVQMSFLKRHQMRWHSKKDENVQNMT